MSPLQQKLDQLPSNPGVYLFKDDRGTVLYVGKASNVRHRVTSYFHRPAGRDAKTLRMLARVSDIETIVTDTEKEALILENNLIKEHHPRYNIKLRDDKNYPCLRLSMEEEFPTLCVVRRIKKDRSLYFGPYPSATSLRETLKLIRRLFPIRTCHDTKFTHRLRPCINYEMGRCSGPCCGKIDPVPYREIVRRVRMFLEGKNADLIQSLRKKMKEESERLNFEAAAKIRDQITHIEKVVEKQKSVSKDFTDQDVIGLHRENDKLVIHLLFVRAGKLLGGEGFTMLSSGLPEDELLDAFLRQYYRKGKFIPDHILLPTVVADQAVMEEWLSDLRGKKVRILVPERGEKKQLLEMACENAEKFLRPDGKIGEDQAALLEPMMEELHLTRIPRRIEGFDISNIQGKYAVGSMVCFEDGSPAHEKYRHYKIRAIEGADDYGMMYEVLLRRYQRALKEGELPDLVVLDGGRGQLNVGLEVFNELAIKGVDLISLAKGGRDGKRRTRMGQHSGEKIFHPQFKEPFNLRKHSPLTHLLDRIRDEAHRFAITHHKKVRTRETVKSALGEIPGIGEARQRELLKHLGSVQRISEATQEELAAVPKMSPKTAQIVYAFFHSGQK